MIEERLDGDIYLFGVRIYNGKRQAPVGWARLLMYSFGFVGFMVFLIIWLSV